MSSASASTYLIISTQVDLLTSKLIKLLKFRHMLKFFAESVFLNKQVIGQHIVVRSMTSVARMEFRVPLSSTSSSYALLLGFLVAMAKACFSMLSIYLIWPLGLYDRIVPNTLNFPDWFFLMKWIPLLVKAKLQSPFHNKIKKEESMQREVLHKKCLSYIRSSYSFSFLWFLFMVSWINNPLFVGLESLRP